MSVPAQPKKSSPFDRSLVEGPISPAVWKLAWPTMIQNLVAGLQGVIDHALVGHLIGYTANAAIGVSWQIFLVVIVFMASLFTGQAILVARYAGAGDSDRVNKVVQQAFLTAIAMYLVLAPFGYFAAPYLLSAINAAPEVQAQALPFLRLSFLFSIGMLMFFMLSSALRAAGDARTPLRLGVTMTVLNVILNVILIGGLGPIPALGTVGSALGTGIASCTVSLYAFWHLFKGDCVIRLSRQMEWRPNWGTIRALFRFGLPTGVQGIAMNVAGVLLLRFIGSLEQSAAAQAAYAIGYTELFSMITWTSVGLMGASATIAGQNLGAGHPERAIQGVHAASRIGLGVAAVVGILFVAMPQPLLAIFGATDPNVAPIGEQLLRYLSPLFITLASQIAVPIGMCFVIQAMRPLLAGDIWLAILLGHFTRCVLTVIRFRQGKWRHIKVEIEGARA
jgi:putative MATE family efflux protein